eukprot:TRINITY_DN9506_c0_g1_i1.p1 TRINITY_DN9506_c0_g1~~TRINITY_DN9506_c0_g1_i1.p1  ORF type:complete len:119 (+),score=42.20 TRINITY_DN9506_c0_g1_i1:289-645(+)
MSGGGQQVAKSKSISASPFVGGEKLDLVQATSSLGVQMKKITARKVSAIGGLGAYDSSDSDSDAGSGSEEDANKESHGQLFQTQATDGDPDESEETTSEDESEEGIEGAGADDLAEFL